MQATGKRPLLHVSGEAPCVLPRTPGKWRILLVDPCALCRVGLALLLRQLDPRVEAIAVADDEDAVQWLRAWGPCDLVVLAVTLPAAAPYPAVQAVRLHWPEVPILALLAGEPGGSFEAAALHLGATAGVARSSTPEQLSRVVTRLLVCPADAPRHEPPGRCGSPAPSLSSRALGGIQPASVACQALHITPCQAAVLRLICNGLSTKLICRELGLSEGTIKAHTHAVFRALSVKSRVQAAIAASGWDWSG